GDPRCEPQAGAGGASGGSRRGGDGARRLELGVAAGIADDAHADALVEPGLELLGKRDVLDLEALQGEAELGEGAARSLLDGGGQRGLARRHVEEGHVALSAVGGQSRDQGPPQLAVEGRHRIGRATPRQPLEHDPRIGHPVGVHPEGAQPDGAELAVADRDGVRRPPGLVDPQAQREEVHLALERRLEELVPVHQIGEEGEVLGPEGVATGAEEVRDPPLVDHQRGLRLAHDELRPLLDLEVDDREAPDEELVVGLVPLDDVDELLLDELERAHGALLRRRFRAQGRPRRCIASRYASSSASSANASTDGRAFTMSNTARTGGCRWATTTPPPRASNAFRALTRLRMPALLMYARCARSKRTAVTE